MLNRMKWLILALTLCVLLANRSQAQDARDPNGTQEPGVTIALTKLDVNDTELKLSWKIKNNTDHDIWICSSLSQNPAWSVFEHFMDEDNKTLVIRRRFDLPIREGALIEFPGMRSRYVRLQPGHEKLDLFSLTLPVEPSHRLAAKTGNADYAERLVLEIGFYDEDLPALILQIVELAEHFGCNLGIGLTDPEDPKVREISDRFFGGRNIGLLFRHILGWSESVRSGGDAIWMPHLGKTNMGEKVLRMEVDSVSIPYKDDYLQLSSHGANCTRAQQGCNMDESNKDKLASENG